METIDDYWAQYCALSRHGQLFIEFLQEREVFGIKANVWQIFHNAFEVYVRETFDNVNFYEWMKCDDLNLIN